MAQSPRPSRDGRQGSQDGAGSRAKGGKHRAPAGHRPHSGPSTHRPHTHVPVRSPAPAVALARGGGASGRPSLLETSAFAPRGRAGRGGAVSCTSRGSRGVGDSSPSPPPGGGRPHKFRAGNLISIGHKATRAAGGLGCRRDSAPVFGEPRAGGRRGAGSHPPAVRELGYACRALLAICT